jgi:hypothetical protein
MRTSLSFSVSPAERATIKKIVNRTLAMQREHTGKCDEPLHVEMDITACHASGNPLRLDDLLAADDFNFAHDVFGIARHLNRETGELQNFFSPRFSARVSA